MCGVGSARRSRELVGGLRGRSERTPSAEVSYVQNGKHKQKTHRVPETIFRELKKYMYFIGIIK